MRALSSKLNASSARAKRANGPETLQAEASSVSEESAVVLAAAASTKSRVADPSYSGDFNNGVLLGL